MAMNVTPSASTVPTSTTSFVTSKGSKRRGGSKAPDRRIPSSAPAEILFKDLPNPFHPPSAPFIWIDFPQADERLQVPEYVIRLGVGGAEQVELSIDKGPWQACRLTSGYWWFDWSNIARGRHTLVARMRTTDGRLFRTSPRTCEYRP